MYVLTTSKPLSGVSSPRPAGDDDLGKDFKAALIEVMSASGLFQ